MATPPTPTEAPETTPEQFTDLADLRDDTPPPARGFTLQVSAERSPEGVKVTVPLPGGSSSVINLPADATEEMVARYVSAVYNAFCETVSGQ